METSLRRSQRLQGSKEGSTLSAAPTTSSSSSSTTSIITRSYSTAKERSGPQSRRNKRENEPPSSATKKWKEPSCIASKNKTKKSIVSTLRRSKEDASFPLASLLSLSVPFSDHVLPHLSLRDLSALEMVDKACFRAMRSNPYWKRAWHRAVDTNCTYKKISQRIGVDRCSDTDVSASNEI